ncbi:MAG TPA: protein-disulfide reductase DsbD domain-containing protein [Blastocatellia bacterium]|nr:protein-disulfide reductase DsbD domain-containing protein [Blastocatellia bacterium]
MKFRWVFISLALLVALAAPAMAQTSSSVVKVTPGESSYKVKQGAAAKLELVLDIDDGYHINSNRPNDKNLIATAVKFDKTQGLTLAPVVYPKAKMQKFEFSEKPLSVFEGKTVLKLTARAGPALPAGNHVLKGKLTVQACNNQVCLRPQTVDVEIPLEVVK